ncbi:ABC transporter ATP-binding protein [Opitutaceae bacterium TAV4]|nr:ABC transporter ATP-binding protein [Opitutaceae bacterium TAV4]RRK02259.1 ABC transporter ATP-binding protein [Opitutaceae bacterium TAV3]
MPILTAENLHRTLGEGAASVHALRGVSLQIEPGRTYAIAGHSGSGKSTLLYLLGLLDLPDQGKITIDDRDTHGLTDIERTALRNSHMGFVFQFHFLLKEFTTLENVMLPMRKLGKLSERDMRDKAADLLTRVGLADKTARLGNQLSGGEQQRVAIARSLANDPILVLADEPTGNLDQANAGKIFDLLAELTHTRGNALLMVSHNPELAARCDHVFHMKDGLIDRGA